MRMRVTLIALALSFAAAAAWASNCPVVIKQGREAAAKLKADDPKVKEAVAKLGAAQKLHESGKHRESLQTAEEALGLLGVKK